MSKILSGPLLPGTEKEARQATNESATPQRAKDFFRVKCHGTNLTAQSYRSENYRSMPFRLVVYFRR